MNSSIGLDRRISALSVAWCINTFAYSIAYPFLPLYLHSTRGFPMSQVGLMYLIMGLARMSSPPVCGPWIDRFGRRGTLIVAPGLRGVAFFFLAWAVHTHAGFGTLAALLFLVMFIGGFFQNASDAYVADITPAALRPEAFSRIRVGLNLGWMSGPAVGAFLARTPFELLFAVTGTLCLVTPIIVWRTCPEPGYVSGGSKDMPGILSVIRRDHVFLQFLLFMFPLLLVSSQLVSTLSIFGKQQCGMTGNEIGFIYTLNGLLVILLQLWISRATGGLSLASRVALGALCYAVGFGSFAFCGAAWQVFVGVAIFTFGEMLSFPSLGSGASRLAPAGMVGRYMGIYGLVWGLGYSVGPFLGSVLYERIGTRPLLFWGVISASALAAAALFLRMRGVARLQTGSTEQVSAVSPAEPARPPE